jgi:hypothetical protein
VLDWTERDRNVHWLAFHRDLARLRRDDPVIARRGRDGMDGSTPFPTIGALRLAAPDGDDRLLIVNTGIDLKVPTIPDPLFSAGPGVGWRILFTTDAHEYGGRGTVPPWTEEGWNIPGRSTVLLAPDRGGN